MVRWLVIFCFFDPATTEIYTHSLHDALPIYAEKSCEEGATSMAQIYECLALRKAASVEAQYDNLSDALAARGMSDALERLENSQIAWESDRSEEHTYELQSRLHLECRLLLENNHLKCHQTQSLPESYTSVVIKQSLTNTVFS